MTFRLFFSFLSLISCFFVCLFALGWCELGGPVTFRLFISFLFFDIVFFWGCCLVCFGLVGWLRNSWEKIYKLFQYFDINFEYKVRRGHKYILLIHTAIR